MKIPAVLAAALPLGGCASMDKPQCVNANWYAIGKEDGARGQRAERLEDLTRESAYLEQQLAAASRAR